MPYIPPCRRSDNVQIENNRVNQFMTDGTKDSSSTEPTVIPDVDSNESFPTLGKINNTGENTMNFASSLFKPCVKEKVVKQIDDGWVCIQNKEPRFLFGDRSKDQDDFDNFLDFMEEVRLERIYYNILDRYERYEEEDLIRFGENHIYSWQVDDYIKDQELERKLAKMDDEWDCEESSDDDSITYEFN